MNSADIDGVNKTLQIYFEGNKELNSQKILSVWDENLKIISTEKTQGPPAWIEMEEYYRKEVDDDMSKWGIEFDVKTMDVFRNCASVRVDVKYRVDTRTFKETQFLHLLKRGADWIIYSKIFTFY